jgi:hypothetical protein
LGLGQAGLQQLQGLLVAVLLVEPVGLGDGFLEIGP